MVERLHKEWEPLIHRGETDGSGNGAAALHMQKSPGIVCSGYLAKPLIASRSTRRLGCLSCRDP